MKKKWILLDLGEMAILAQLQLEEALLRLSSDNFCLFNRGKHPTLVMGISGNADLLFHETPSPKIRRYSGGGAVLIDKGTFLLTFIGNKELLPEETTPTSLHRWAFSHWKKAFQPLPLQLIENDYCIENRKIGGNAQYLTKDRFVHHSTFLWDFCDEKMALLKMPPKMPNYRNLRPHPHFLDRLCRHFPKELTPFDRLVELLWESLGESRGERYVLERKSHADFSSLINAPHRRATELID